VVDEPKLVSLPDDLGVLARHSGQVGRQAHFTRRMPPDRDDALGEILNLALHGAGDVNHLYDDLGRALCRHDGEDYLYRSGQSR
jgi:hypothetical protein